ncbi:hypothetical protein BJ875DRAFT_488120 [Amylocarpus encephaloides]|uniref:Uncharacterized protein n=1 Tax=Amylocarpus encephaloides TaxID=45428 RepID=A0A9P8C1B7_9HELO|nr:hypothetical protein BJ875DRAFT_488120 [Amylocarpus encephaloides]
MSLVSGTFTGLACKVSPSLCMSSSSTTASEILPRAAEINPDVLESLETRQIGLIPHQQDRYDRMVGLAGDVRRIEGDIVGLWQSIENNGPYYMFILNEIAKTRGYPDAKAMALEAETFMAPGEANQLLEAAQSSIEDIDQFFDIQRYTSGAVSTLSGAAYIAGKWKWVGRSQTYNYSKMWRSIYIPGKIIYNRVHLLYLFKTGKMGEDLYKIAINGEMAVIVKKMARELPSGVIKAKAFKYLGVLGGAIDFVAGIGFLIAEGVLGVQQRADIREAIKNLHAARYSAYYLLHTSSLLKDQQSQIQAALDNRVTQQIQVDNGQLCFEAADSGTINKIAAVAAFINETFSTLTEKQVYDNMTLKYDNDVWTDDDLDLAGINKWIDDHPADGQAEADAAAEQATPIPVPAATYHVTGAQVSTPFCNYVEFENNKGAMWKLNGPIWTLQGGFTFGTVPFDIGAGSAGTSQNAARNFRIRLDEIKRTNESIYVQYQGFSTVDGSVALSTNPVIELRIPSSGDGSGAQLRIIPTPQLSRDPVNNGTIVIGGTGSDWTVFTIKTSALSNLVPSNEFTAWKGNFEDRSLTLYECNIAKGWEHLGTDGFLHDDLYEVERKNGLVSARRTDNEFFRIDMAALTFNHTVYRSEPNSDPWGPPGPQVPHFEQLKLIDVEPRMVFT